MATVQESHRTELVWLLSTSVAANDDVLKMLDGVKSAFPRHQVLIQRFASAAVPPLEPAVGVTPIGGIVAAAVLVLEPNPPADSALRQWTANVVSRAANDDAFRLFVCLQGWTVSELEKRAKINDDFGNFLANLTDVVHIHESPNPPDVVPLLKEFLLHTDELRATAITRVVKTKATEIVGNLAGITIGLSFLAVPLIALVLLGAAAFGRRTAAVETLVGVGGIFVPLVAGWTMFPALSTLLFLQTRNRRLVSFVLAYNDDLKFGVRLMVVVAGAAATVVAMTGQSNVWLVQGILWGVVLDVARRSGVRAMRSGIRIEPVDASNQPFAATLKNVALGWPVDPFVYPFTAPNVPRVFISYTKHSPQGVKLAAELYERLQAAGARCFLDRKTIVTGTSWRRQLALWMAQADVVLVLADPESVDSQRIWIGAELRAALMGRAFTGTPDIIVLMQPRFPAPARGTRLPYFDELLTAQPIRFDRFFQPRLAIADPPTLDSLTDELRPGNFTSTHLLPTLLVDGVRIIQAFVIFLALPAPLLGCAAVGIAALFLAGTFNCGAWLAANGWIIPAYLAAGFGAGCAAGMASRTTVAPRNLKLPPMPPYVISLGFLVPTVGFLTLLGMWPEFVSKEIIGWACLAGVGGWIALATAEMAFDSATEENQPAINPETPAAGADPQ